jgi:hypothetical protein
VAKCGERSIKGSWRKRPGESNPLIVALEEGVQVSSDVRPEGSEESGRLEEVAYEVNKSLLV